MEKFYVFDLEGVLCQTKDIYLKTLVETFFEYKDHFDRLGVSTPTSKTLEAIIQDLPISVAKKKIFESYPFLYSLKNEVETKFYKILQDEIKYADDIKIDTSIEVFRYFYALGKAVLFTNAPKEVAMMLLDRISLKINEDALISCDTVFKPDIAAFLKLFEHLQINPSECVLIDDSFDNIVTAVSIKMKAVYFNNFKDLSNEQKDFLAANQIATVCSLPDLIELRVINKKSSEKKIKTQFDFYDVKKLTESEKKQLATETYPVYRALFYGRDYTCWQDKFLSETVSDSFIYVVRSGDEVVGFCWSEFFDVKLDVEHVIAVKYYTAFLKKNRNRWLVQKAFLMGLMRGIKKYKQNKIYVFENIVSPFAYKNGCIFFGDFLYPQPKRYSPPALIKVVSRLSEFFDYQQLSVTNPFLVKSQSMVYLSPKQLDIINHSKNVYYNYYREHTKMQPGVGIAVIITIRKNIIYYLINLLKVGIELCRYFILKILKWR